MRSQDIVAARAQMRQLQAELRGAVVRLKSIDEMSPADLNLQPQVRAAVDADPTMRTLREMLVKATIERDNVAQSERKNFEARLASIRGQMTDREQDVSKGQVSALREQCRDRVEELSHQVLETQSAIDKLQAEFRDLATRNEDIDRLRRQEANLEERIAALDKELLAERLHVTDAPRVYVSPAAPRDLVTTHPARP
jgi:uncharacterized coiled-coil protein SlyX